MKKSQKNLKMLNFLLKELFILILLKEIFNRKQFVPKIKSHHNVGGLPKKMNLKLIEPLKDFFKDEVRVLGTSLGLTKDICFRHPFPPHRA